MLFDWSMSVEDWQVTVLASLATWDGHPTLITFVGADHTEGMLTETDRYRDELVGFFQGALG